MSVAATREAELARADERPLVTPEGVALRLNLAPVSERLAALLLDLALMLGTLIVFSILVVVALFSVGAAKHRGLSDNEEVLGAIWILGFFLLRNFYFIHFEAGARAATPGKRALGIRVASRDGGRLAVDAVFARNLMRELEFYLPLELLAGASAAGDVDGWEAFAGFIWTLVFVLLPCFNRDKLRLGDIVAGTWVVRAPKPALGLDLTATAAPAIAFTEAELDAYGELELTTLEAVLRRDDAKPIATVAAAIRGRLGRPATEPDRAFLDAYYAALRARLERGLLFGRRRKDKRDRSVR